MLLSSAEREPVPVSLGVSAISPSVAALAEEAPYLGLELGEGLKWCGLS